MRPNLDFLALARLAFSPEEYEAVAALAPEKRDALFYEYWSCKEACIKADGRGISVGLDQFTVIASEEPLWRRVSVRANCGLSEEMRIRTLAVRDGYAAAVAAPAAGWEVTMLDLK